MNKKILSVMLLFVLSLSLSACASLYEPQATLAPGITNAEGGVVSTNPRAVEGRVSKLEEDRIVLKVQGVDWELKLNDHTKGEVARFAELGMPIMRGSMLMVYYWELVDGSREATKLEHLNAN